MKQIFDLKNFNANKIYYEISDEKFQYIYYKCEYRLDINPDGSTWKVDATFNTYRGSLNNAVYHFSNFGISPRVYEIEDEEEVEKILMIAELKR